MKYCKSTIGHLPDINVTVSGMPGVSSRNNYRNQSHPLLPILIRSQQSYHFLKNLTKCKQSGQILPTLPDLTKLAKSSLV